MNASAFSKVSGFPISMICRLSVVCLPTDKFIFKTDKSFLTNPNFFNISLTDVFRAKVVDVSKDSVMIEITGNMSKIEAFISLLDGFTIEEMVRTGLTGLTRGNVISE